MKFGLLLQQHLVEEWETYYISYEDLKALIEVTVAAMITRHGPDALRKANKVGSDGELLGFWGQVRVWYKSTVVCCRNLCRTKPKSSSRTTVAAKARHRHLDLRSQAPRLLETGSQVFRHLDATHATAARPLATATQLAPITVGGIATGHTAARRPLARERMESTSYTYTLESVLRPAASSSSSSSSAKSSIDFSDRLSVVELSQVTESTALLESTSSRTKEKLRRRGAGIGQFLDYLQASPCILAVGSTLREDKNKMAELWAAKIRAQCDKINTFYSRVERQCEEEFYELQSKLRQACRLREDQWHKKRLRRTNSAVFNLFSKDDSRRRSRRSSSASAYGSTANGSVPPYGYSPSGSEDIYQLAQKMERSKAQKKARKLRAYHRMVEGVLDGSVKVDPLNAAKSTLYLQTSYHLDESRRHLRDRFPTDSGVGNGNDVPLKYFTDRRGTPPRILSFDLDDETTADCTPDIQKDADFTEISSGNDRDDDDDISDQKQDDEVASAPAPTLARVNGYKDSENGSRVLLPPAERAWVEPAAVVAKSSRRRHVPSRIPLPPVRTKHLRKRRIGRSKSPKRTWFKSRQSKEGIVIPAESSLRVVHPTGVTPTETDEVVCDLTIHGDAEMSDSNSDPISFFNSPLCPVITGSIDTQVSLDIHLKQLKLNTLSLYRRLVALSNFAALNRTGFSKICKKFDKNLQVRMKQSLLDAVVNVSAFAKEPTSCEEISHKMIQLYSDSFEGGNYDRAKFALLHKSMSFENVGNVSMFVTGIKIGFIIGVVSWLVHALFVEQLSPANVSIESVHIYRGIGGILLWLWFWSFDVYTWTQYRLNYVFIFELSPKSRLSYHEWVQISANLSVIYCVNFLAYIKYVQAKGRDDVFANVFPASLFIYFALKLFCPVAFGHWPNRKIFLECLFQCIIAPFGRVRFRDFFLGDLLCSMVKNIGDLYLGACGLTFGIDVCMTQFRAGVVLPLLICAPYWMRFMQCLNRYFITRRRVPHLVNSVKYALAMSVTLLASVNSSWTHYGNSWFEDPLRVVWLISMLLSTTYTFVFDIRMDSGLFSTFLTTSSSATLAKRKKEGYAEGAHKVLGRVIEYPEGWYYAVVVYDFILRFVWIFTLLPTNANPFFRHKNLSIGTQIYFIAAVEMLELMRRGVWSLFRVERAHLNGKHEFTKLTYVPLLDEYTRLHDEHSIVGVGTRKDERGTEKGRVKLDNVYVEIGTTVFIVVLIVTVIWVRYGAQNGG